MRIILLIIISICINQSALAQQKIVVLDFELNDITSLPNIPAEITRTAGLSGLLKSALQANGEYQLIEIDAASQRRANASFGYLFNHREIAAKLAESYGADWVLVSQHSKPSFLFSQMWTYLVKVDQQQAVARYDVELKGNHQLVSQHAVNNLAGKIMQDINKYKDSR